jgi:hypothetical protein
LFFFLSFFVVVHSFQENARLLIFQVVLGLGDCDDSVCTSIPQDLDFISSDEGGEDRIQPPAATTYQNKKNDILPRYASCTGERRKRAEASSFSMGARKNFYTCVPMLEKSIND